MIKVYMQKKGGIEEGDIKRAKQTYVSAWIDILDPTDQDIKQISDEFEIPYDIIKDAIDEKERPRLMELDAFSLIIYRFPVDEEELVTPLAILISKKSNVVITLRHFDSESSKHLLGRFKDGKETLDKGVSYLAYKLMDLITRDYFKRTELIEEKIDALEERVYKKEEKEKDLVKEIFHLKKKLIYYHKSLLANREVVLAIEKEYSADIEKRNIRHFRTLSFDLSQIIETTGTQRELLTNILEIHFSRLSHDLNISVKKLTAWGALILIPTLISGIYGMNFKHMPELQWQYGYLFAIALMFVLVAIIYINFKSKDLI